MSAIGSESLIDESPEELEISNHLTNGIGFSIENRLSSQIITSLENRFSLKLLIFNHGINGGSCLNPLVNFVIFDTGIAVREDFSSKEKEIGIQ